MTEDICYKRPFLTSVIARVDFPSPIAQLERQLPKVLSETVTKAFPIAEPRPAFTQELQIRPAGDVQQQRSEYTEWRFHGQDREKTFTIVPRAVFVEYKVYTSYEGLKNDFLGVLSRFFEFYKDTQGSRLGLRYINNIELPDGDPLNWEQYLNKSMLSLFGLYPDRQFISRAFHNLELNFDDFNLRYQFGMPNPDYPARIRKKTYALDLDAYRQGPQDFADISESLDKLHERIQEVFELSITHELRRIMND